MSEKTVIQCQCGASVRVPRDSGGRTLRCPRCRSQLTLSGSAKLLQSTQLKPGEDGAICPICQTQIATEDYYVECPECAQTHHQECWSEIGGCGTYGCKEAPSAEKDEQSVQQPLTAWGDTKRCPACGEEIKSIALRCRYCQTDFDSVDPMNLTDLRRQSDHADRMDRLQKSTVAIFVVSLVGCLAPIMLFVSLAVVLPERQRLTKSGPVYAVMGWASIILSALYSLLIVLFLIFD